MPDTVCKRCAHNITETLNDDMIYVRAFDENQCEYYHLTCNCSRAPCVVTLYGDPTFLTEVQPEMIAENLVLEAKCKQSSSLTWNIRDFSTGKTWNAGSIGCRSQ